MLVGALVSSYRQSLLFHASKCASGVFLVGCNIPGPPYWTGCLAPTTMTSVIDNEERLIVSIFLGEFYKIIDGIFIYLRLGFHLPLFHVVVEVVLEQ